MIDSLHWALVAQKLHQDCRRLERELGEALGNLERELSFERELSKALEWKRMLSRWGVTPEIVNCYIKGQQQRIQQLERKLVKVINQRDTLVEAGEHLQKATMNLKCPQPLEEWLAYTTASIEFENALTAAKGGEG